MPILGFNPTTTTTTTTMQKPGGGGGGGSIMAWNVFRFCTGLRALGSIMIVFVLGMVGLTYYVVVIANYGPALFHGGVESLSAFFALLLFHFLLVMLLWSYFTTVLTDPGGIPANWQPSKDEESGETGLLVGSGQNGADPGLRGGPADSRTRFCRKCNQLKPPRCHHCSICGRCILKMDHHCVWVVNCVGALNYKYFLLLLFYTFLETALVSFLLLRLFIVFFTDDGEVSGTPGTLIATVITFVLNLSFALSILGFLIMHIVLVLANTTTIEAFEKKTNPRWRFDVGRKKNFEQVFGMDKRYWFLPAYSEDDLRCMPVLQGFEYPTRPDSVEL
ncbi:putative protein S-acyltransferase 13 [Turnera subulata]|uniref:S-acyltransferase n=1 Tax=Turnera subulata TaxID=218843 RepID=A0A9Q0FCR4_9ROSI|nr:putative protein S-acyltransferase 13 [Turnera subulata]